MYTNWRYIPLVAARRAVILDTDIGPDCDDAGAIALLMEARARMGLHVAGIVNCTANAWANGAIRALTQHWGVELPVAQTEAKGLLEDAVKFDRPLAEKYVSDPEARRAALPAVDFYREALTNAEDDGAVIVSIGQLSTVAAILEAEPELVRRKVHALVAMAGAFPEGREFNVFMDVPAAQRVFAELPCPIICSGFEVGVDVLTGFAAPPANAARNPVYDAYRLYLDGEPLRPSWDLTAVHFALEGEGAFYALSEPARVDVDGEGNDRVSPWDGAGAPRYYLKRRTDAGALARELQKRLDAANAL